MRIKGTTDGYMIWLSASDTHRWSRKAGAIWPCSALSGNRFFAAINKNGLYDFTLNGKDGVSLDENELAACISDHLPLNLRQYWPCWELTKTG